MTVHQPIALPAGSQVWQLRVQDFLLLNERGSFADYAKAELLDGEIWVVNAIHSRHASVQAELHGRLWSALAALGSSLKTYITPSIDVGDTSLPEPDLVVGEPHEKGFVPLAKVALLIEVSDTTLDVDLGRKLKIYARAAIAEYWVVDINECVIHRLWSPTVDGFSKRDEFAFGSSVASTTIDGLSICTLML